MKPVNLDTLLTFERVTDVADSNGGASRTWSTRGTAWAAVVVNQRSQQESERQGAVVAGARYTLTCRAPDVQEVLLTDRVHVNGDVCNITAIYRPNRAIYVELQVTSGEAP